MRRSFATTLYDDSGSGNTRIGDLREITSGRIGEKLVVRPTDEAMVVVVAVMVA